jgi:hypothetical protein
MNADERARRRRLAALRRVDADCRKTIDEMEAEPTPEEVAASKQRHPSGGWQLYDQEAE